MWKSSPVWAAAACVSLAAFAPASPARADNFADRFTVNLQPVYLFSSNGDSTAPPPAGSKGIGYTGDHPTASTFRFNYGADFKIDAKTHLSFSHTNVAYQLGRIETLAPKTSLVTGAIYDYTDTISLSRALGNGLSVHATYDSHQRSDVTGLCLNQKVCAGPGGAPYVNPVSIDEMYYTVGGTYDFGPKANIGKIFTAGFDVKYVPRSGVAPLGAALGGLGHWVGTQTVFPYSITAKIPITPHDASVIPFINYTSLPVLYHDSAVPEEYRGVVFGLVKVIDKHLTLSYTNLNLQSCRCVARVPAPDNLRLAFGILGIDIHTQI